MNSNLNEEILNQIKKYTIIESEIDYYYNLFIEKKLSGKIKSYSFFENKIYYNKTTHLYKTNEIFKKLVLNKIENESIELINTYYKENFDDIIIVLFLQDISFNELYSDIFKYKDYNINKIWSNKFKKFLVPNEHVNFVRGLVNKGKTRPEHSKLMKELHPKGIRIGNEDVAKRLKSIDFKKKVLLNKNILQNEGIYTDEYILTEYSNFVSKNRKSIKYKLNNIKKFIKYEKYLHDTNYNELVYEISKLDLDNLDDKSILDINTRIYSYISSYHTKINENMGNTSYFIRTKVYNLKYNLSKKDYVKTRSSYETVLINILEENKIYWDYENIIIKSENSYNLNDFLIKYNCNQYILELKGFLPKRNINETIDKTVNMFKYTEQNNLVYKYFRGVIKDINKLLQVLNDNQYTITDSDIQNKEQLTLKLLKKC
jgi:hypothetical protein